MTTRWIRSFLWMQVMMPDWMHRSDKRQLDPDDLMTRMIRGSSPTPITPCRHPFYLPRDRPNSARTRRSRLFRILNPAKGQCLDLLLAPPALSLLLLLPIPTRRLILARPRVRLMVRDLPTRRARNDARNRTRRTSAITTAKPAHNARWLARDSFRSD
jgi:hypothetical protein